MVEEASAEVMAERVRLADRVRNELLAAGLPVGFPQVMSVLSQGAEVGVDGTVGDGAIAVTVEWHCHPRLQDCARNAYRFNRLDNAAFRHNGAVKTVMLSAMIEILGSAGFEVQMSEREYDPLTLEVLSGPEPKSHPSWAMRDDEMTMPGWHSADPSS